jgi:hypothetical protein
MNPLASRKQLLIAESELNRAHLAQDWQALAGEANELAQQAATIRSLASASVVLISELVTRRQPAAKKTSWLQSILKGAQLAGSLWTQFRSPPKSDHKA